MAMPASGCIALRTCITGCACSSISCAVAGIACSPASLASLSVQAGKSAPHSMTEFYNYAAVTTFTVNVSIFPEYSQDGLYVQGTAYLKCSTTHNVVCSCGFYTTEEYNFQWENVGGSLYVDMNTVYMFDTNVTPMTGAAVYWCDYFTSGFNRCTNPFTSANGVSFTFYDYY